MGQQNNNSATQENLPKFFSKWFYISLLIILVGCILSGIDTEEWEAHFSYLTSLASEILKVGGSAMFISNIFTFTIETSEFIEYIKDKIRSIVVSKEFITSLKVDERRNILNLILKPSTEQSVLYSNMNEYFNRYIDESMKLFDETFRSGLVININARCDHEQEKIYLDENIDYTAYKFKEGYEPLKVGFETDNSIINEVIITADNGTNRVRKVFKEDDFKKHDKPKDPTLKKLLELSIPDEFRSFDHIDIIMKQTEHGEDSSWYLFSYRAFHPCDKLTIIINCHDNIVVKNCITYGKEEDFTIDLNKDKKQIEIIYQGWLSPGFGVSVLLTQ